MYDPHPSIALNRAFAARPFQGAEPERATYLFVGLDANYSPLIEQNAVFGRVLDYLNDGVAFWQLHGVHHPFLLPEYRGDGRKYHKTFSAIGFRPEHADQVSFIEMLHLPTVGRSNLTIDDLDKDYLARLRDAIERGDARHIFVPEGVARLMRESSMFEWMPKVPSDTGGPLKIWRKTGPKTIYWHYHFSVYGKFEQKKTDQLKAIGQLLNSPA
jgi:hypothetical protein